MFSELTRDAMVAELRARVPEQMKGMSRATKADLIKLYDRIDFAGLELRVAAVTLIESGETPVTAVKAPVPDKVGRRTEVMKALSTLGTEEIQMLVRYSRFAGGNRHQRRTAFAVLPKIRKFLPSGITLDEAVMVCR